jgi:hypothetical protein
MLFTHKDNDFMPFVRVWWVELLVVTEKISIFV